MDDKNRLRVFFIYSDPINERFVGHMINSRKFCISCGEACDDCRIPYGSFSQDIVGMFEASLFAPASSGTPQESGNAENFRFLQYVKTVRYGLNEDEVKSYILTRSGEIHWSPINCRTLRKRWKAAAGTK